MALEIEIDRDSKQAIYQQIAEQIKTQIGNGRLPANTRLPPIRQLAGRLATTRLTVQNAYSELQAEGWVEATVGRGTFVSRAVQSLSLLPTIGQYLTPDSAIQDMMQLNEVIGVRSLAMADPDPAFFPIDEFWSQLTRLQAQGQALMRYGPIQGDTQLRVALVGWLANRGITAVPETIIITAGALQAIAFISQVLAQPGDAVMVEQPTYIGTLNIIEAQKLRPLPVPLDEEGPDLAVMAQLARQHRPRYFYTVPNFQNPTGHCMSPTRRRELLQLAQRYGFTIVEDDIYGPLAYDAPPPLSLKALAGDDSVIYVNSFSKTLMPGLRLGYLLAPDHLRRRLLSLRRAHDLCSPPFVQRAVAHFISDGGLERHIRRTIPVYRRRRDALLQALQQHLPDNSQWSHPAGGFCCWVRLAHHFAPGQLYRTALQQGLAFTPGEAYRLDADTKEPQEHLRLCFGNQTVEGIQAGVKLLGDLIAAQIDQVKAAHRWQPLV